MSEPKEIVPHFATSYLYVNATQREEASHFLAYFHRVYDVFVAITSLKIIGNFRFSFQFDLDVN